MIFSCLKRWEGPFKKNKRVNIFWQYFNYVLKIGLQADIIIHRCNRKQGRGHDITLFASEHSDPALHVHSIMSDVDYDHETLCRFRSHELCQDFISTHHAYLELMYPSPNRTFPLPICLPFFGSH